MASYVVAASLFIIGSSYLLHFVVEPPGGNTTTLEHLTLKSKAEDALNVLIGSPGVPTNWDASWATIDAVSRLGLVETGSTIRIDAEKFDGLARGRLLTTSTANGGVDYDDAKKALGLTDHEFHLRAYPIISPSATDPYGVSGYDDFRIAYVGKWDTSPDPDALSANALEEIVALEALNVDFTPTLHDAVIDPGDVFIDDSNYIRDNLLPNIGAQLEQTVIGAGSGTKYDFYRVAGSTYEALTTPGQTRAMALSSDGMTLGYTKNRELRVIIGEANLAQTFDGKLTWKEWVDTDRGNGTYDCGDYGFVEVSHDGGANWIKVTDVGIDLRSQDCNPLGIHAPAMTPRTVLDITDACALCANDPEVLIAFHWVGDNDNNIGYGWVVDDVKLEVNGTADTALFKTFENPAYDMVIVGSDVAHNAFTPEDVKAAIRDYVDKFGGRLFVTGPSSNVQWLDRLFDAGTAGSSGGVSTPDRTHPLLTLPNQLAYDNYQRGNSWDFTGSDDAGLFSAINTETNPNKHIMSVSRQGAWGESSTNEGSVILSSYLPHAMTQDEASKFFANVITYGKYHYLYLDVGPTIPTDDSVASVARSATMNMHRTGDPKYTEMAFIVYVWPGKTAPDVTSVTSIIAPSQPRNVVATGGDRQVTLTWNPHLTNGTTPPSVYRIYRSDMPANHIDTVNFVSNQPQTYTYTYTDTNEVGSPVDNGVTYYYTIRAYNGAEGTPSDTASATPIGQPSQPNAPTALGIASAINVAWSQPADTGGASITGYNLWVATNVAGPFTLLGDLGSVTSYQHSVGPGDSTTRYYRVVAINAWGLSLNSSTSAGASAIPPVGPPTLTVTDDLSGPNNLTLNWIAPADLLGQTLTGFQIYRSSDGSTFTPLTTVDDLVLSYTDVGLGPSAHRWYRVAAITNVGGEGTLSASDDETTPAVPPAPTAFTATRLNPLTTRSVAWVAPVGSEWPVTHYELWGGADAGSMTLKKIVYALSDTHDPGVASSYTYGVKAVSPAGTSAMSNTDT